MHTACDRVHTHKNMQNDVNKAIISMGSNKNVNKHILSRRSMGLSDRFILFGRYKLDLAPCKRIIDA